MTVSAEVNPADGERQVLASSSPVEDNETSLRERVEKERNKIPDDSTYWPKLRHAYFQAKASAGGSSDDQEYDDDLRHVLKEAPTGGAKIDFEIRWSAQNGRGVYAKQLIPEGTPVWMCSHVAMFSTEDQWLAFLKLLPEHMQLDCVEWAYVEEGDLYLDLDQSALMNHGGAVIEEETDMQNVQPDNLECVEIEGEDDEWMYVAKCDIQPGDELLCDYSKFHDYEKPLEWFDDSHEQVFEEGIYY